MATTAWRSAQGADIPIEKDAAVGGSRVLEMSVARRFVSEVVFGRDDLVLTDALWEELCRAACFAQSDELAVARVVLEAYALRRQTSAGHEPHDIPTARIGNALPLPALVADQDVRRPVEPLLDRIPGAISNSPDLAGESSPKSTVLELRGPSTLNDVDGWTSLPDGTDGSVSLGSVPRGIDVSGLQFSGQPGQAQSAPTSKPAPKRVRAHSRLDILDNRRRERWLTVASWVRNTGAIILLFVAWQLWGTAITEHHSQEALKNQFEAKIHHSVAGHGSTLVPAATRIVDPPDGTVMAELQIPKIGLSQFVVSGTDEADLAKGPGHYLGTAMPGQAGNVAIAGHRTTHGAPFNRLAELAVGDRIYLTTLSGRRLTYIVSAVPVAVSPKDVSVLNNFGDNRITLTTCNPEYSAIQRLIVVGAYLPPGATHPEAIAKGSGNPYGMAPSEVSGWNTNLLPIVFVELAALVALGLFYRRLSKAFGKEGRWIILVPLWVALLLALFETLTNFLPAAV